MQQGGVDPSAIYEDGASVQSGRQDGGRGGGGEEEEEGFKGLLGAEMLLQYGMRANVLAIFLWIARDLNHTGMGGRRDSSAVGFVGDGMEEGRGERKCTP